MTESPYRKLLDEMVWSYSRLHIYAQCPAAFRGLYLSQPPVIKTDNAFAEWGSLGHSLLERFAKGELMPYEMEDAYLAEYPEYMKHEFPPSRGTPLDEKYFQCGKDYFGAFEGFPLNWEALTAEMKVEFKIDEYPFVGYIDLPVRDRDDGRLIVVDHKSKAGFKSKAELAEYAIQLYLYSKPMYEKYGEYPKQLIFNLFRENTMVSVDFNMEDYIAAQKWAVDTIHKIYQDVDFWDKIYLKYELTGKDLTDYHYNDFFCNYLCSFMDHCDRSRNGVIYGF